MRRMTRSFRSRKNVMHQSALRDQFLRELTRESEVLLKQLSEQFQQTLNAQLAQSALHLVPGDNVTPTSADPTTDSIGRFGQLLSTGVRYLVSRPRTSTNMVESSRSVDSLASFRTSQAQMAAELQAALSKGEKNT